jgi:hypothetical protein
VKNYSEWQGEPATFQMDEYDYRAANRSGMIAARAQATPMNMLAGRVKFLLNQKMTQAERERPGSSEEPAASFAIKQELMREIFAAVEKLLFQQEAGGGKAVNQARLGRAANKYDQAADMSRKAMGQGPQL